MEKEGDWIKKLVQAHVPVTITLKYKRANQGFSRKFENNNLVTRSKDNYESIVGSIKYRPGSSFFRKDLAHSLIRYGRADVAYEFERTIREIDESFNGSHFNRDIDHDSKYKEHLQRLQIEAIRDKLGMFADTNIRHGQKYKDLVQEVESDMNKNLIRKIWEALWKRISKRGQQKR